MGYGDRGAGADIPGGATLKFDVEVMSVSPAKPEPNLFAELDLNGDGTLTSDEVLKHFQKMKSDPDAKIPDGLMEQEDKDKDGVISWEEFGGPKGITPPNKDEV